MKQWLILSVERGVERGWFVGVHGVTPMFSVRVMARRFSTSEMATAYARTELFTEDSAFRVVPVPETESGHE